MILTSEKFYNILARVYDDCALLKQDYSSGIDSLIFSFIDSADTMLDVGCGTGKRSKKISEKLGVKKLYLIDQSDSMLVSASNYSNFLKKIDFGDNDIVFDTNKFELVTCLWNVLGHIGSRARCIQVIKNIRENMSESGFAIIDVNNRYNMRQYGFWCVLRNMLRDFFTPNFCNGDYIASFDIDTEIIKTSTHIFSPFEIRKIFKEGNLKIVSELYVDYKTGKQVSCWVNGQLLYVLKK